MNRFIASIIFLSFCAFHYAQGQDKLVSPNLLDASISYPDTLKSYWVKKDPPYLFKANLNHKEKSLGSKIAWGFLYSAGYNTVIMSGLLLAPESLNKWPNLKEKLEITSLKKQYKIAYNQPPVIDHDLWMTNYIGHPYQGAYYYNSLRSQGGTIWQSALFGLSQAVIWEYGWEAGLEQPSIQDLITTPIGGAVVGELAHVATIAMSKHGFTWYEIAAVCAINPAYALNNGFHFNKPVKMPR